jgi:hypothetical protein
MSTMSRSKFANAVEIGLEGLSHGSVGLCSGCSDCPVCDGEESDEGHFSWQSCEVCGSSLGGDRYAAHALDKDGNLVHLEVCVDCLAYIANGEEPETWEE